MSNVRYDGPERREQPMHMTPLAECVERYKAICDKLDNLILRLDKMNGRYDEHLMQAIPYRTKVDIHDQKFNEMTTHRRWLIGIQVTTISLIVVQIITFAYLWGGLTKQVEINTGRWEKLINGAEIHEIRAAVKSGGVQ